MTRVDQLQAKLASVSSALGGAVPRAVAVPSAVPRAVSVPSVAPRRTPPPESGFWDTVGSTIAFLTGAKAVAGGYKEAVEQQHERMRQQVAAMSPEEIAAILGSKDASTAFAGAGNSIERWIAGQVNADLFGQMASGLNKGLGAITPSSGFHPDISQDLATDIKGWKDLAASGAHVFAGRDVHSPRSPAFAYYPPSAPAAVSVSGQADVSHTMHLEVTLDPELRAEIRQAISSQTFVVPLIGGGAGRMDSDARPNRSGGIGHQ
jgi:hypothetical protein